VAEGQQVAIPGGVKRVIVVTPKGPVTVFEQAKSRKKTDRELRPLRRIIRGVARARAVSAEEYLRRFDRSDSRRKNGWLRGHIWNTLRATREGNKQLRKIRVI
jgi:hypothetical protein